MSEPVTSDKTEKRSFWRRRRRPILGVGISLAVSAGLVFSTFVASPLPAPAPFDGPVPVSSAPAEMAVYAIPTGVTHRSAAFAYRGGSFRDKRDFAMTAVLVRHPKGDVLVDTGFGRAVARQLELMPAWFRMMTSYSLDHSAAEQLDAAHYDRGKLRAVYLTHGHWDHASGIGELAGTPIAVPAEEHRFIEDGGWITAVARTQNAKYEEYSFDGGPYLGFPKSHDVYGDGAIVVVPAPGHTPGSVIVFLSLPSGKRYALVGDLVWQREGITEREERPFIQRTLGDTDPEAVRVAILRMAALSERWPDLVIVPAHDRRGFDEMPRLPTTL